MTAQAQELHYEYLSSISREIFAAIRVDSDDEMIIKSTMRRAIAKVSRNQEPDHRLDWLKRAAFLAEGAAVTSVPQSLQAVFDKWPLEPHAWVLVVVAATSTMLTAVLFPVSILRERRARPK